MKITVKQSLIEKVLNRCVKMIKKTSWEYCKNVRLTAKKDSLTIEGTDLEKFVKVSTPAEVEETGQVAVRGDKLTEVVNKLQGESLTFEKGKTKLEIREGRSKFKLPTFPTEDIPISPKRPDQTIKWTKEEFLRALNLTLFAAAKEPSGRNLDTILLEEGSEGTRFVGTNGHRLAFYDTTLKPVRDEIIIPRDGALFLKDLLLKDDTVDVIEVGLVDSFFFVGTSNTDLWIRLGDQSFPDYRKVIEDDDTDRSIALLNREEPLRALKKAMAVTDSESGIMLTFENNQVLLNAKTENGSCEIPVDASYEDEKKVVFLNPTYLIEPLSAIDTKEIKILLRTSTDAVYLKTDLPYCYLVMPMRREE